MLCRRHTAAASPTSKQKKKKKKISNPSKAFTVNQSTSTAMESAKKKAAGVASAIAPNKNDEASSSNAQNTRMQSSNKKKNTELSISSPFKPNLTEAFSNHLHRASNTDLPVSDRLYQDAVHRTRENAAGIVDAHCQHELDRERALLAKEKAKKGGGNENDGEDHVHLKSEHPFATDLCPKADYLRRMGSSMSVDGGSIEDGE